MDDEGEASSSDIIYVIIGVICGILFLCGTTLGCIKYQVNPHTSVPLHRVAPWVRYLVPVICE